MSRYPTIAALETTLRAGGVRVSDAELRARCDEPASGPERVYVAEVGRHIALTDDERRALGMRVVEIGQPITATGRLDYDDTHTAEPAVPAPPERCRAKPQPTQTELQAEHLEYARRERAEAEQPKDRAAQRAEVLRLRKAGKSLVDISIATGVSAESVRSWTRAAGLTQNRRNTKLTDAQVREIRRLAASKTPHASIARRYGVVIATVRAIACGASRASVA